MSEMYRVYIHSVHRNLRSRGLRPLAKLPSIQGASSSAPSQFLRAMSDKPTASSPCPVADIASLDHLVLTVVSIPATVVWYSENLGMTHERFKSKDSERHALRFGAQKINLHESGNEFEPKATNVQPGSGDLCFLTQDPIEQVLHRLRAKNVEVLEGGDVVDRTGAKKKLRSVYVRDPDGNLIEISNEID